jgi:DNA-binding NarL/FixJ family response regulator
MQNPIKILAFDDQPFYVQGITSYLAQWSLVGKVTGCNSYDELLSNLRTEEPDIVFMELSLHNSRLDGLRICREITSRYKNVLVAVHSRHNTPELIKEAQQCGARAYIDKYTSAENIYNFLHDYWQGKMPAYYVQVSNRARPTGNNTKEFYELLYTLTKREREVMTLIVEGHEHEEIENELAITYSTYKTHRSNILQKLNFKNEVELTRFMVTGATQPLLLRAGTRPNMLPTTKRG